MKNVCKSRPDQRYKRRRPNHGRAGVGRSRRERDQKRNGRKTLYQLWTWSPPGESGRPGRCENSTRPDNKGNPKTRRGLKKGPRRARLGRNELGPRADITHTLGEGELVEKKRKRGKSNTFQPTERVSETAELISHRKVGRTGSDLPKET